MMVSVILRKAGEAPGHGVYIGQYEIFDLPKVYQLFMDYAVAEPPAMWDRLPIDARFLVIEGKLIFEIVVDIPEVS